VNKKSVLARISHTLGTSCVLLLVISLLYRSFVWPNWLPVSGEPYGAGDILEALLWLLVLVLCAACLTLSAVFAMPCRVRNSRSAVRMLAIGIGVPLFAYLIYPHLPLVRLSGA